MIEELSKQFNLDRKLTSLLIERGIDTIPKMSDFLYPDIDNLTPISSYKGALAIASRLNEAIKENKKILIYGDYDTDGICSVSMLYLYLKSRGLSPYYYIPSRFNDGYGINIEAVARLKDSFNPDIMITVDTGISCYEEIKNIQSILQIEVIVTDHHLLPDKLPECLIFNPKCENAFSELSGAGVVLRLIEAMSGRDKLMKYIDIAAISTIADIVPLINDNRIIAAIGIDRMKRYPRRGIKFLTDIAKAQFTASDIAYKIAPRINAAGRLTDANKVVELFISEDYFLLQTIVKEIDNDNRDRRLMTEKLYIDALKMLENYDLSSKIIILHKKDWDIGILGIAASKIAREFMRPAILLTTCDGIYKGSGRSIEGVDLYGALLPFNKYFKAFGGHSQAVGLSIEKINYENFFDGIISSFKNQIFDTIKSEEIDYDINDIKIFKDIERLEPFGCGNCKPVFKVKNPEICFSQISNTEHIKAKLKANIEIVGFNMLNFIELLNSDLEKDYIIDININRYNGFGQGIINNTCFSPGNKFNNYIEAQYIKQLLYTDATTRRYRKIDCYEKIGSCDCLKDTLFIASRLNSCYNVVKENGLDFHILKKKSFNPVPSVIVAPVDPDVTRYYGKIVFLDKPLSLGYIERFNINKSSEIIVVDKEPLFNFACDDNEYHEINKAVREVAETLRIKSIEDLYLKVLKKHNCDYLCFSIAFFMMFEQGIIKVDKDFNIKVYGDKLDLSKSVIYRRINEHRELYK